MLLAKPDRIDVAKGRRAFLRGDPLLQRRLV